MYSNQTEKYSGVRVVDAFTVRADGTVAVSWVSAAKTSGHDSGVSTLQTFAKWARRQEMMSEQQIAAHSVRAQQHAECEKKYGAQVRAFVSALKQ
ncbi:hypothetical protein [Paracidovorax wautersii]|uniref:hypothetical protein n=1 Tax=Paracidovorax wautersii TaxID=1177982 RepID=UPI0011137022|nr:hypothetical protein [Paracidovorax wautersii]